MNTQHPPAAARRAHPPTPTHRAVPRSASRRIAWCSLPVAILACACVQATAFGQCSDPQYAQYLGAPGSISGPSNPAPGSIVTLHFVPAQANAPAWVLDAYLVHPPEPYGQLVWSPGLPTEVSFRIPTCAGQDTYVLRTRIRWGGAVAGCDTDSNPVTISWGTFQSSSHIESPSTACVGQMYQVNINWDCGHIQDGWGPLEYTDDGGATWQYPDPPLTHPCNGPDTLAATLQAPSQPGTRLHRLRVLDGCGAPVYSNLAATTILGSQPTLLTQPVSAATCPTGAATFSVTAGGVGGAGLAYQWQWRRLGQLQWQDVLAGTNTDSVGYFHAVTGLSMNLDVSDYHEGGINGGTPGLPKKAQFLCVLTSPCGSITSNPATLTICPADFDCNGYLAVADIFAFLNAWFAGSPTADFDGINGLQVADIFAFLNAWFSGC